MAACSNGHATANDAPGGVVTADGRKRRLRVLFMHGLESRPHGTKYQELRGPRGDGGSADAYYFDVMAPSMRGILWILSRPRGLRHWLLVIALALVAVADVVGVVVLLSQARYWQAVVLAIGSAALALIGFRALIRWCVARCCAVQTRALRDFAPDVVVGLSFGGAIATYLLLRRVWTGPTLLLAPAGSRVQRYAALSDLPSPLSLDRWAVENDARGIARPAPIHVVHTPRDRTIPIADTEFVFGLGARPYVTVERVNDSSHALREYCVHPNFRARIDALYHASLQAGASAAHGPSSAAANQI